MVSVSVFAFAALGLFSSTGATVLCDAELPVGEYYRPSSGQVSGRPNATTPYRRSPCPGVNTLANHGYLSRDGKNITRAAIKEAVMTYFHLNEAAADAFTAGLPAVFDLNQLSVHNDLEHDASLIHADSYLGEDPAAVNHDLLEDFFRRVGDDGVFGVQQLGEIRKDRLATCLAQNPNCSLPASRDFMAFGEAALVLTGFGNATTSTVDKDTLRSFLEFERFPENFSHPEVLTTEILGGTAIKIQAVAAQMTA
ncbi:hypothetical protein Poli38472_007295 [Pythium oligandrum]|uniref:Heme haloperoxidase family profile domain-containing protein n=1 Tax=Pythium oligandrum TaxID=41045 RepID=A0A8K1CA93_PYTOL|nr:hypothetical protein Poli38472_007295 [Pythium oligandrum]|eukprot:TMW59150.1 hypothetical protein Poli38472_007295 [Pythium oligandrum]